MKKIVREPFCVSEKFWYAKNYGLEEGYRVFPSEFFVSPKTNVGEPFCASEKFWYVKKLRIREGGGGITFSCLYRWY